MLRLISSFAGVLLVAVASAFEPGDQLVVIHPAEMKTITGTAHVVTTGTPVTVRASEGDKLKVASPRVGWIDAATTIPSNEAEAYFSRQAESGSNTAAALLARGKVRFHTAGLD